MKLLKKIAEAVTDHTQALHPDDTLEAAGERMRSFKPEAWPVIEGEQVIGTLDVPDPDRKAARYGHDPKQAKVRDMMKLDVTYCYEDDDCETALQLMQDLHLHSLPVMDRKIGLVCLLTQEQVTENLTPKPEV